MHGGGCCKALGQGRKKHESCFHIITQLHSGVAYMFHKYTDNPKNSHNRTIWRGPSQLSNLTSQFFNGSNSLVCLKDAFAFTQGLHQLLSIIG